MSSPVLSEFQECITAFRTAVDKLTVTCAAVRLQEKWVSLYTCITLSNSLDTPVFTPRSLNIGANFIGIFVQYAPEKFDFLLKELESSSLTLESEGETFRVFMNRIAAGLSGQMMNQATLQFFGVMRPQREYAQDKGSFRPSIEIGCAGDRMNEVLSNDEIGRISKQLRTLPSPVNGLQGLLHAMESKIVLGSSDQIHLDIKAVLPFETMIEEEQVQVRCPESVASKLSVVFFLSPRGSERVYYSKHLPVPERPGWCIVPFPIPWGADTEKTDAHVYYDQEEVEKFTIRHWGATANWRLMVDNDFDPGAKLLSEALKGPKKSEIFEQAVVRLLTLGGIPATWYGESRESRKPDLAAYYQDVNRRIVVLGECTLDKPQVKVASLKSRADKLRELLGSAAAVLPIVFTSCDPVEGDYTHAAKAGIALLGCKELAEIFQLVENHARPADIIKLIEEIISSEEMDYPMIARWAPRY
jgi:hypothetical protein